MGKSLTLPRLSSTTASARAQFRLMLAQRGNDYALQTVRQRRPQRVPGDARASRARQGQHRAEVQFVSEDDVALSVGPNVALNNWVSGTEYRFKFRAHAGPGARPRWNDLRREAGKQVGSGKGLGFSHWSLLAY